MSDRVRFGTCQDDITPANSSGFNGFPFPSLAAIPGFLIPSDYPITTDFARANKWWWRVKSWNLVSDFSASADDGAGNFATAVVGGDSDTNDTRELDLIVPRVTQVQWNAQDAGSGGVGSVSGTYDTQLFGFPNVAMVAVSPNFQPRINVGSFSDSIVASSGTGPGQGTATLLISSRNTGGFTGSITATIDGLPFTLYYAELRFGNGGFSFVHTTFILTPASYWPYAGANGNPIYNTASGALLPGRSPLD